MNGWARGAGCVVVSAAAALWAAGCDSGPKRIDPIKGDTVTSMGMDFPELVEASDTLSQRMLADGFLDRVPYPHPVRMVVSDIENKTNLSDLDKESLLGRIRSKLRGSGKVVYVSTYGSDATDSMSGKTQELRDDDRFKAAQVPRSGNWNVAPLSLRTQILYQGARTDRAQQNTYEVRMFVTDVNSGDVVWEGFSDPVGKRSSKPGVGW